MYSVVMMMAMTGAPETPAWFRRNGCDGGGCYGSSCWGNGCSGYSSGCHGGGRHRGGCYGGGCHGYSSGCCGCHGYSSGCSGYTSGCGCQGYASGCYGQANCGGCDGCGGMMATPPATGQPPAMPPKDGKKEAMLAAPATIVVSLPAEASLKIDGVSTKQTSAVRQFTTPPLAAGQSFFYTLTAEIVRDGQTLTSVQQVTVRAGEQTTVTLPAEQFGTAVAMK